MTEARDKLLIGSGHRKQGRLENIDPVDLGDTGRTDAEPGVARQIVEKRFPFFAAEFFRIIKTGGDVCHVEYKCDGNNGPGKRPPPGFINAGNSATGTGFK